MMRLPAIFLLATTGTCLHNQQRHCSNPPQRRYELLRDFIHYMAHRDENHAAELRWSLAFGSLLGAMRQDPPGFIQKDDDLDIYMPARDLAKFHEAMDRDMKSGVSALGVLTNPISEPCCSFGLRLVHRDEKCAYMDFFAVTWENVKGIPRYAPMQIEAPVHDHQQAWHLRRGQANDVGSQRAWLIPGIPIAGAKSNCPQALMAKEGQFKEELFPGEWSWAGAPNCLWNGQETSKGFYMLDHEFLPLQHMQMYNLSVKIPKQPWQILNRFYGSDANDHDNHGHDFRKEPQYLRSENVTREDFSKVATLSATGSIITN